MNNKKRLLLKDKVKYITIPSDSEGQRIDNFLINYLKKVPKSHIYRIIRKGQVRVNKGRVNGFYRLLAGDKVRLPPLYIERTQDIAPPSKQTLTELKKRILYEDENLLVINKPSGMSVHAGNTIRMGIIEAFKFLFPKLPNLELAHRLDSETSGCLILAKKKKILRELHELLRNGMITKLYWALTLGRWKKEDENVNLPLYKHYETHGKHRVSVHHEGKSALTVFRSLKIFKNSSLVEAKLFTGRTHQIRVHAASKGHPIAGDERYGDSKFNKKMKQIGLSRMFLHARSVDFILPSLNQHIRVEAPLDRDLEEMINDE